MLGLTADGVNAFRLSGTATGHNKTGPRVVVR